MRKAYRGTATDSRKNQFSPSTALPHPSSSSSPNVNYMIIKTKMVTKNIKKNIKNNNADFNCKKKTNKMQMTY